MLPPIKRVFVPKPRPLLPEAVEAKPPAPVTYKPKPGFNELPAPDMEEKNSDSVWAEFESVKPAHVPRK
jgi:hypothetical protein